MPRAEPSASSGGADGAGVLAELGEGQLGLRAELGRVEQLAEPALDRIEVEVGALGQPAAEHEHGGIEGVGEVDQAEGDPAGELVDDRQRTLVALLGRRLHVLAAHQRRIAAGDLDDASKSSADGGGPGQLAESGPGRVALPAARAGRTGTAGRWGRRPCGRTRRRTRCARRRSRPPATMPPPMPVPSVIITMSS